MRHVHELLSFCSAVLNAAACTCCAACRAEAFSQAQASGQGQAFSSALAQANAGNAQACLPGTAQPGGK
jgi:hypothetical protein